MTKKEIFQKALRIIESGENLFMCNALELASGVNIIAHKQFPEILEFKPGGVGKSSPWFPTTMEGKQKRIEILKELIKRQND